MGEQVVMSLGVEDLERAKHFYADGLGFERGPGSRVLRVLQA